MRFPAPTFPTTPELAEVSEVVNQVEDEVARYVSTVYVQYLPIATGPVRVFSTCDNVEVGVLLKSYLQLRN